MAFGSLQHDLQHLERVRTLEGIDTVKLWESFREEANLWRGIALIFLPVTALALLAATIMYLTADTEIEVPQRRPPHVFQVTQLPDKYFIDEARDIVNLIASFTPEKAKAQFQVAKQHLWEPALTQFEKEIMVDEMKTILDTRRTQLFLIVPEQIRVYRDSEPDKVIVRVPGVRQKLIGNQPLPTDEVVYYVKLTTIPRNLFNEYGIVAVDIRLSLTALETIKKEDEAELELNKRGGDARKGGLVNM